MAKYRKVDPRIWNDAKFMALSDQGKLAFFFLLTHPHMTAIGAMRASLPGLAAEIGWTTEAFTKAFAEASYKGMAKHDERASFLWLPKFIKYNKPENPNVVKAWGSSLDLLPECALKTRVITDARDFVEGLTEAFIKALPESFEATSGIQEQEQEQEQEEEALYVVEPVITSVHAFSVTDEHRDYAKVHRLPDPETEILLFTEHYSNKQFTDYDEINKAFRKWLVRARAYGAKGGTHGAGSKTNPGFADGDAIGDQWEQEQRELEQQAVGNT